MKFPLEGFQPPEEVPTPQGSLYDYVEVLLKRFYADHPFAVILGTEWVKQDDGSMVLEINAIEPSGDS